MVELERGRTASVRFARSQGMERDQSVAPRYPRAPAARAPRTPRRGSTVHRPSRPRRRRPRRLPRAPDVVSTPPRHPQEAASRRLLLGRVRAAREFSHLLRGPGRTGRRSPEKRFRSRSTRGGRGPHVSPRLLPPGARLHRSNPRGQVPAATRRAPGGRHGPAHNARSGPTHGRGADLARRGRPRAALSAGYRPAREPTARSGPDRRPLWR